MRTLVVLAALVGCADSPEERLAQFKEASDISCWAYSCDYALGGASGGGGSVEDAVACMNDALASGKRAMASWSFEDFRDYTEDTTYVFAVDHELKIFTTHQYGETTPEVREGATCAGPTHVGGTFCVYMRADGQRFEVPGLDLDGCP